MDCSGNLTGHAAKKIPGVSECEDVSKEESRLGSHAVSIDEVCSFFFFFFLCARPGEARRTLWVKM